MESVGNTIYDSKYNSSSDAAKTIIGENKKVIQNFMYFVLNTRKKIGIIVGTDSRKVKGVSYFYRL